MDKKLADSVIINSSGTFGPVATQNDGMQAAIQSMRENQFVSERSNQAQSEHLVEVVETESEMFSSQLFEQRNPESSLSEIHMQTFNSQTTDSIRTFLKDKRFNYGNVLNAMRDTIEIENEKQQVQD